MVLMLLKVILFIVFLEDDALPEKGWLNPILEDFQNGEKVVQAKLIIKDKGERKMDMENRKIGKIRWNMRYDGNWNYGRKQKYIDLCAACGVFIKKQVFEKVSYFEPYLVGSGYGDSISFSLRLKSFGFRILFDPNSVIYHLGAEGGGSKEKYNKTRSAFNGYDNFSQEIAHNLIYLNKRFNKKYLPFSIIYYILAGFYISLINRNKCISLKSRKEWKRLLNKHGFEIITEGTDVLWDLPYFSKIPLFIQKIIFIPLNSIITLIFGFLPWEYGENYICISRRK